MTGELQGEAGNWSVDRLLKGGVEGLLRSPKPGTLKGGRCIRFMF